MIVFNSDLLFVHNPKTAGTSLIRFLLNNLRGPVYAGGVAEFGTYHPHLSLALGYACAKTGNRPDDFKHIISVVRNPYDREVSMYTYYRQQLSSSPSLREDLNDPKMLEAVAKSTEFSFKDYLKWLFDNRGTCDIWDSRYYYMANGDRIPKNVTILKIETLSEQIQGLIAAMQGELLTVPNMPNLNQTKHDHFANYFDKITEELVYRSYIWAFDLWKFDRLSIGAEV